MKLYSEPPRESMSDDGIDLQYLLIGGPLNGATICIDADLTRDQSQVRITIEGAQHVYLGDAIGEALEHVDDAAHLGHAWRPVRWIDQSGRMHIFSDDRPVMPAEVAR